MSENQNRPSRHRGPSPITNPPTTTDAVSDFDPRSLTVPPRWTCPSLHQLRAEMSHGFPKDVPALALANAHRLPALALSCECLTTASAEPSAGRTHFSQACPLR